MIHGRRDDVPVLQLHAAVGVSQAGVERVVKVTCLVDDQIAVVEASA